MAKKASSRKSAAKPKATKKTVKKTAKKVVKKAARKKVATGKRKIKNPLAGAQLDEFRRMLMDKRRDLVGDMNGIEAQALGVNRQNGTGNLSSMPTHPADIGTDNYEQEFTLGLLESERALLNEIDEALERINNHTYGVCLGTGKPIGKTRLRARPWAKYCIEYARMVEKGLVRLGEKEDEEDNADAESGRGEE